MDMKILRIITLYFKIAKQVQKRNGAEDSTKQLVIISKYLWFFFSSCLATAFIIFTRYKDESDDFLKSLNLSAEELNFKLILFSLVTLLLYHFVPSIRRQSILSLKHYPHTTLQRFLINFSANIIKVSVINILGIWIIFSIGNPDFFSLRMLFNSVIQLLIILLVIYNVKELFLWEVPKMFFLLLIDILIVALLLFTDLVFIEYAFVIQIAVFIICILLSLTTEYLKIERRTFGELRTRQKYNEALINLPIRNGRAFAVLKFVLFFELVPLISYNYLTLDLFKRIMFFTMMLPLALMTNYGNNVFGFAFKLSLNLFYRPLNNHILFRTYLKLMLVPFTICFITSATFFTLYSESAVKDLIGYLLIASILFCTGFLLAIRYPVRISDSSSWLDSRNQAKQSLIISASIGLVWLVLMNTYFYISIIAGICSLVVLVIVIFYSNYVHKFVMLFKQKLLT
ncbi:MAG TPA: hypothetical protein VL443_14100 [Cyclobacteriaceae bacterium]|jgi:hypothetical protein|nr:hypothetical protein [Cyclobacteriaceae bacterium]